MYRSLSAWENGTELNLFESYFKYQLSDDSTSQDIFMIHYQLFENPMTYGQTLVAEWKEIFDLWQGEKEKTRTMDSHRR